MQNFNQISEKRSDLYFMKNTLPPVWIPDSRGGMPPYWKQCGDGTSPDGSCSGLGRVVVVERRELKPQGLVG